MFFLSAVKFIVLNYMTLYVFFTTLHVPVLSAYVSAVLMSQDQFMIQSTAHVVSWRALDLQIGTTILIILEKKHTKNVFVACGISTSLTRYSYRVRCHSSDGPGSKSRVVPVDHENFAVR